MVEWLQHPAVQSALLPLLIAVAAAGLLRRHAAAAVPLAWFSAYGVILGLPAWPPLSAGHKLAYAAAAGFAAAMAGRWLPLAALLVAAQTWLAWPRLAALPAWLSLAAVAAAGVFVLWRLSRAEAVSGGVMVAAAAVGLAGIALLGGAASLLQLAGALAAALGGLLLWAWPKWRPAAAAVLGAGVVLGLLATQLTLFTRASPVALALLLPLFLADLVPCRPWARPLLTAALCLPPLAAALAVAAWRAGGLYLG